MLPVIYLQFRTCIVDLSKIAIYVDGPTEEGALTAWFLKTYYSKPEFRYGPGNGVDYSIQGYAKNITPKVIQNLKSTIHHIIFIPDFEKRKVKHNITFENFIKDLKTELINTCVKISDFTEEYLNQVLHVCPSNIMFENWIISDIEGIQKNPEIVIKGNSDFYDGQNGCSILSSMMEVIYKKTIHAKKLYKYVEPERGTAYSESYRLFYETIKRLIES